MTNIYNLYFLSHFLNEIRNTILFCFKKNENNKKSLFHTDFRKARVAGFEPANDGIRIRCLTTWRYPIKKNWASWIRTSECRSQSPVPYRLAIAHYTIKFYFVTLL